jgi:hypothetical protein
MWLRLQRWLAGGLQVRSLMAGNMLLTGKHTCRGHWPEETQKSQLLTEALEVVAARSAQRVHALLLKDVPLGHRPADLRYLSLPVQPNMVVRLHQDWTSEEDYLAAMTSKYRVRARRARKKARDLERRSLNLLEIVHYQKEIYALYRQIAAGADYNAVQLPPHYFRDWKERFPDRFHLWGYFREGELVGFATAIQNGDVLDAHYLGLDDAVNHQTQLYLNMLYDLIGEGIRRQAREVNLSRTALEIKSSAGAKPEQLQVWLYSRVRWVRPLIPFLARWLAPVDDWQERHPFK